RVFDHTGSRAADRLHKRISGATWFSHIEQRSISNQHPVTHRHEEAAMKDTGTTGANAVDWEARVDFDRLRRERLARLKAELDRSDLGAVLAFDFSNIRYMTATHIGTW